MNKNSILYEIERQHLQYLGKQIIKYHELRFKWNEVDDKNLVAMYTELINSNVEKYFEVLKWLTKNSQ